MLKKLRFRLPLLLTGLIAAGFAHAQLPNLAVTQIKNISLATFGAGAGNDCWGYVSPSGREYAIMGMNNRVGFVEITDPAHPVVLTTIPHSSSTWGDIKVYGHYAYAVTETSGTGIQVIDMSQIDSGVVTLVKTITSPGRTHNLALNADSGYLYTCGSRDGTGTTMCFSLLDPANPVRVGANTMTASYQHDANVVSYTSGPLAGKEIWYGCSEDRGVDIYDLTDKNNPKLIKRVVYPSMGYCHQAWLSADRKYLYVDDELDETNAGGNLNTRSLIFNVEDPANAFFVGTFTSGLPSIDHNQYVVDGFTFQANYQSGLRIFDLSSNPEVPVQVGSFDTFPTSDGAAFNGAWSTYPFFPSGTVIVSDINTGLYILDATEATTRKVAPKTMVGSSTTVINGSLGDILASDNVKAEIRPLNTLGTLGRNAWQVEFSTTAYDKSPLKIRLNIESSFSMGEKTGNAMQIVELFDWTTNEYVQIDSRTIGGTDQTITVTAPGNATRFANSTTQEVKARLRWTPQARTGIAGGVVLLDQLQFKITR